MISIATYLIIGNLMYQATQKAMKIPEASIRAVELKGFRHEISGLNIEILIKDENCSWFNELHRG